MDSRVTEKQSQVELSQTQTSKDNKDINSSSSPIIDGENKKVKKQLTTLKMSPPKKW